MNTDGGTLVTDGKLKKPSEEAININISYTYNPTYVIWKGKAA